MKRYKIQKVSGAVLGVLLIATLGVLCLFFFGILFRLAVVVSLSGVFYKFVARCIVSPRSALRSLLGVMLLVVVLAVSWCMGSDRPLNMPGYDGTENVPFWLKVSDMFLYAIYTLLGIALALIAGFGIARRFR